MIEDLLKALVDVSLAPEKEKLKESMLEGMNQSARFLVGTLRLGEKLNIFDSVTYSEILNRMATEHFEATEGMNPNELLKYMTPVIPESNEAGRKGNDY